MNRVTKISKENREILIVDYSDCREQEMIALLVELKNYLEKEKKRPRMLSIFNERCYLTPNFMKYGIQVTPDTLHLIEKQAIVGLSETKKTILTGYNLMFRRNIPFFDTKEEAIEFLLDENTTNVPTPEFEFKINY